ncbi:MAG: hypothetical protein ACHQ03_10805 [Candidatus Bathyarchaeia archaeon]
MTGIGNNERQRQKVNKLNKHQILPVIAIIALFLFLGSFNRTDTVFMQISVGNQQLASLHVICSGYNTPEFYTASIMLFMPNVTLSTTAFGFCFGGFFIPKGHVPAIGGS